jgi:4-hydroxy-tetrahydrodipicolinate synthase
MALPFTKSEAKVWAKKNFKGLEAVIFPSFTPDLQKLDEEGIRWDVNHIIDNGFMSAMCAIESCGLTFEERKQFVEIVCKEAKGKIHTSLTVLQDTVEEDIQMLKHAEKVGCSLATIGHPVQYYPRSAADIYAEYKYVCDSTNLAIIFFPGRLHVRKMHPTYFPPEALNRIADIPNVVGMKVGGGSNLAISIYHFRLVGDRILVNDPMPDRWFVTIPVYHQQWAGAAPFYAMQTTENKRIVNMFNTLVKGDVDKALDTYWEGQKGMGGGGGGGGNMDTYFHSGIVTAMSDKYAHWLVGGNGGTVRQPTGRLYDYQKEAMRAGVRAMGITPREPEEEFYVGRVNYAKGARMKKYEA